ncbi:MAG: EpsI family protein [Deltaproteobacteria bacterium]|nr:EpsI family protein [Deltaproteobacteria bacterium]
MNTLLKLAVALLFIGLNLYVFRFLARADVLPDREQFAAFPQVADAWRCNSWHRMDDEIIEQLGVTDYLLCDFVHDGDHGVVNVYTGYHATQTRDVSGGENVIHTPEHCLPGAGWDIIQSDIVPMEIGLGGEAKRVVVAKGNARNLVYFWYQSRGRMIASHYEKVLYLFVDRALDGRTDGSLVRFTVPILHGDEEKAEATFLSVAQALTPLLPDYVPN